jgi:hypothetical protein
MSVIVRRPKTRSPMTQPDGGYEESHGYGPSHGGPTGPGDAPATPDAPDRRPSNPSRRRPQGGKKGAAFASSHPVTGA